MGFQIAPSGELAQRGIDFFNLTRKVAGEFSPDRTQEGVRLISPWSSLLTGPDDRLDL